MNNKLIFSTLISKDLSSKRNPAAPQTWAIKELSGISIEIWIEMDLERNCYREAEKYFTDLNDGERERKVSTIHIALVL